MGLRPLYIFHSFSAGIDFRRQKLTSIDVWFWRLKTLLALKRLILVHRLRLWPKIISTWGQYILFTAPWSSVAAACVSVWLISGRPADCGRLQQTLVLPVEGLTAARSGALSSAARVITFKKPPADTRPTADDPGARRESREIPPHPREAAPPRRIRR